MMEGVAEMWWLGMVFLMVSLVILGGIAWLARRWDREQARPQHHASRGTVIYGWHERKARSRKLHHKF